MAISDSTKNKLVQFEKSANDIRKYTELATGEPITTFTSGTVKNEKSIIWEVRGITEQLKIPDLVMKINPRNLSTKYTQLINRKRTIGGFIEEHWGEQLDELSASGITRGFYDENGLTNLNRRNTDGYREFEKLINIYRNNGSIYDHKTGAIIAQGTIVMNYDGNIQHGYFENFSVNEISEKQFNLQYDFTFKVTFEEYPQRKTSFKQVTTVIRPGTPVNDIVSLNILG